MSRRWNTFWLVVVALGGISATVLMTAAVLAGDYGRAGFNLALTVIDIASFFTFLRLREGTR